MRGFQSPQIVTDLYRDLRDRRLLSIVIALVAGIIVIPVALSSSSSAPTPGPTPAPIAQNSSAPSVAVVASNPGLRDYRRRLLGLGSQDPFKQKFVAPAGLGGTKLGSSGLGESVTIGGSSSSDSTSASSIPTVSTGGGSFDSSSSSGDSGGTSHPDTKVKTKTKTETKYVVYKIKVQTGEATGTLEPRDNLSTLALLPNDTVPALAYIGVSDDHKKALFMVSSVVSAISGDGVCMLGAPTCQLLILGVGQYEDVLWTDGKTYRVQLVKIKRILRNKPPS